MNKVKFMLTALLPVFLLSSCTHASGENEKKHSNQTGKISQPDPGLSPYNPPVELTFVRQTGSDLTDLLKQLPGETLEDNRWSRLYEKVLGIKIKYDWTAEGDSYNQKLGVAIAAGHIPDVISVNAEQLRQLNNAGLIQDLSSAYDKYATPLTKKILSQEGPGPFERATIDGKLMGIPETSSSIEGAKYLWIRTDWLDRLGVKPPKTMNDLLAISKAFTERDPDRNGKNDTYGLAVTQYLWDPLMGLSGFMAGYDAFPNIWIKDASGKLVYGGIQPEVKTALKSLQDMYRSGQIDREFGYKDGDKEGREIAAGKIGMFYGEQWGSFLAQSSRTDNKQAQWEAFSIVSVTGEAPKVPLPFGTYQFFVVKKGYPHPEAVVKLFNLHLEKNWGESAEYDTYYSTPYPVWKLSPVTPYPAMKNVDAFHQVEKARRTGDRSVLKPEAKAIQRNIDTYLAGIGDSESGWGWERTYGPSGAFAVLDQYVKNNQFLHERFTGPKTETMIEKESILYNLQIDTFVNIILGKSIDEFDKYVEEWNKLGGDKITAEVNQWYVSRGIEQQ